MCHFASPHAMPFPIEDTQAYVTASDRAIVVAFRGTEPKNQRDWLTDATTPPVPGPESPFKDRHHRFVNNNDVVPTLSPEPAPTHVDRLRYFDADGRLHDTVPLVAGLKDRVKGATADPFAPASDGVRDQAMATYLACLEKCLAPTR